MIAITKQFKWLRIDLLEYDSKKRPIYSVYSKATTEKLGEIEYYSRWRKYVFYPLCDTLYEQDCLRDIADFCENCSQTCIQATSLDSQWSANESKFVPRDKKETK